MKRTRRKTRGKRRRRGKTLRVKRRSMKSRMMKHLRPDGYYTEKVLRKLNVIAVNYDNGGNWRW